MRATSNPRLCGVLAACGLMAALPGPARAADGGYGRGVTAAVVYDGDGFANAAGGLRRGATYLGNLHLLLILKGGPLLHLPGVTVFLNGLGVHGGDPSALSGDAQGVSNMAAPADVKLYEAWLQWNLAPARLSLLAGRYDLNTEFYRLQASGLFLNSSFGIGPAFGLSGVAGPSIFPDTSLGGRVAFQPAAGVVLRAAVLDGVPVDRSDGSVGAFEPGDGVLVVTELAFLVRPAPAGMAHNHRFRIGRRSGLPPYEDKVAFGGWFYSNTRPDLSEVDAAGRPLRHQGSGGAYVIGEKALEQRPEGALRRLSAFGQIGYGDPRVERFGSYLGVGLVAAGLFPARPDDELGLAAAIAANGSHYLRQREALGTPATRAETAVELTYLAQVTDWLAVQPDVQYIIDPGTVPARPDALAFQLRFELAF